MKALAGFPAAGIPLLKIEIVRDFLQTVGLFFAKLFIFVEGSAYAMVRAAKNIWGNVNLRLI